MSELSASSKSKVGDIVRALDKDDSGDISAAEVKVLFSRLLEIPVEEIPDDHEGVLAFAGLSVDDMIEKLSLTVGDEDVERYYASLFVEHTSEKQGSLGIQLCPHGADSSEAGGVMVTHVPDDGFEFKAGQVLESVNGVVVSKASLDHIQSLVASQRPLCVRLRHATNQKLCNPQPSTLNPDPNVRPTMM